MKAALTARLLADSGLSAVIDDHVSWGVRPQGEALPGIVLNQVTAGRRYNHSGFDGLTAPRLQVDCYASTQLQAQQVGDLVVAAIEPAATVSGVDFGEAFLEAGRDMPAVDLPGGTRAFRHMLEFRFTWAST